LRGSNAPRGDFGPRHDRVGRPLVAISRPAMPGDPAARLSALTDTRVRPKTT
jgi:hypothetical protein